MCGYIWNWSRGQTRASRRVITFALALTVSLGVWTGDTSSGSDNFMLDFGWVDFDVM